MLRWRNPEVIDYIREGIQSGQFEILGSSYAQNVMEATSDWINAEHIRYNREVLKEIFDFNPVGFWNPERVWNDIFLNLLCDHGYTYTPVETKILGSSEILQLRGESGNLTLLPDDQAVLRAFDSAVWSGNPDEFIDLMRKYDEENKIAVYAQDTEAIGFWQIAHGRDPKEIQQNYRKLLAAVKDNTWIEVVSLGKMASFSAREVSELGRGQATWMVDSARYDGYEDYFDYLQNSPEIRYYSDLYRSIEHKFQDLRYPVHKVAKVLYLKSQFEFGCTPGSMGGDHTRYLLNVPGDMTWEGVRYAERLLDYSPIQGRKIEWINLCGHPLVMWQEGDVRALLSPYGGRLVELIIAGKIVSPSPLFYNRNGKIHELDMPNPVYEFPEYGTEMIHGGTLLEDSLSVDGVPQGANAVIKKIYTSESQQRIFAPSLKHTHLGTQIFTHVPEVQFFTRLGDIVFVKKIQVGRLVTARYEFYAREHTHAITLSVSNEVSLDPLVLMNSGRPHYTDGRISVGGNHFSVNHESSDVSPPALKYVESTFAARLISEYSFHITRDSPVSFLMNLHSDFTMQ